MNVAFSRRYMFYMRGAALMAQPYDFRRETFSGEPVLVAAEVERPVAVGLFSSSLNGVLAYQSGVAFADRQLTWFETDGRMRPAVNDLANYDDIELSPDDSKASVSVRDGEGRDLWIVDLERGVRSRFMKSPGTEQNSVWAPDRTMLAFGVVGEGIFQRRTDGTGSPELLMAEKGMRVSSPSSWAPDGRVLLINGGTPMNIWQLPLTGERKPSLFVQSNVTTLAGQFSPDGRWVSYHSSESGRQEVYVTRYPGPGERTLVSTTGGQEARWRGDGRELFYASLDGNMMAVTVDGSGSSFKVTGAARVLFPYRRVSLRWGYDVTGDGRRCLAITADDQPPTPMSVVVNWTSDLER
jgi:dipeptidyl aminopeptidase/acylaminoacyl peptidase